MTVIMHTNSLHGDTATFTMTDPPPVLRGAPDEKVHVEADPWVVVGTTTIDGTYDDIKRMFGVDAVGKTTSIGPTMVGGRMLNATGWHLNKALGGETLVFCDIVRRLSECCLYCDHEHLSATQRERAPECESCTKNIDARLSAKREARPLCPECGPHGNSGRVLLLESWVDCTTCRPQFYEGDVHGEGIAVLAAALNTSLSNPVTYDATIDKCANALAGFIIPPFEQIQAEHMRMMAMHFGPPPPIKISITES